MREIDRQVKDACHKWETLPSYRTAFAFVSLPKENMAVLDFGCGSGSHCAIWQRDGNQVVGIDISEKALANARKNYPDIDFQLAVSGIPLPDNSVDVVISLDSIEHVEDENESLTEMWRVLKPDGRLILTTPYRNVLGDWMDGDNLIFLPLIRLKNLLLRRSVSIPRHRHYTSADILGFCPGKFTLDNEEITGGPHTVLLAILAKSFGIFLAKLHLQDNKVALSMQKKLKYWGQNTHFYRWGPLADKLNIVMRRRA